MTMDTGRHSGFARFENTRARDTFVETVLQADGPLHARAYMSSSQPTIVFEGLTGPQQERVLRALEGCGRWFPDVQFEPTR
jgi:hypothetical protein